jgi:hypothetical protein
MSNAVVGAAKGTVDVNIDIAWDEPELGKKVPQGGGGSVADDLPTERPPPTLADAEEAGLPAEASERVSSDRVPTLPDEEESQPQL